MPTNGAAWALLAIARSALPSRAKRRKPYVASAIRIAVNKAASRFWAMVAPSTSTGSARNE